MKNLGLYGNDLSTPRKQDVDEKQAKIDVVGILQGDGDGSVSAAETTEGTVMSIPSGILKGEDGVFTKAQPGTDYAEPTLGIIGATAGKVVFIKSVDSAGQPTEYGAVDAGGSGDSNVFVITLTRNVAQDAGEDTSYTADKTDDEVVAAIKANMQCYVLYYNVYYPLTNVASVNDDISAAWFSIIANNNVLYSFMFSQYQTKTWTQSSSTISSLPKNPSSGQILMYRSGLLRAWGAYNIGTQVATDFTGIIKGASGKLAQAEAGTDYMSPIPVETADNGKIMQVVDGVWSASEPVNTTVAPTESWIFTLADGSTVIKKVVVSGD